jgi:hypothetical protein
MHPRILAERTALAAERLTEDARRLAQALDLPEDLVKDLTPDENNVQVRPMLVLEACANLVKAAADKLAQPVEIEPIPPFVIETQEGNITLELSAISPAPIAETGDGVANTAISDGTEAKTKVKRGGSK